MLVPTEMKERLLGFLRGGDFAHPGEEEAINMIFSDIPKDQSRTILEVGCGIGGTANYIQASGYGRVTGIDRDKNVIETAKSRYPQVTFYHCDVANVDTLLSGKKFDVICMINSFFYFKDQNDALMKLFTLAHENTIVKIFEYTDLTLGTKRLALQGDTDESNFLPIRADKVRNLLESSGFIMEKYTVLNHEYAKWYRELCEKIEKNKDAIKLKFSEDAFRWAKSIYEGLLKSIEANEIGGCLLTANRAPQPKLRCRM